MTQAEQRSCMGGFEFNKMQQRVQTARRRRFDVKAKRGTSKNKAVLCSDADPFALPKRICKRIRECAKTTDASKQDIVYLWIHVSSKGIAQAEDAATHESPLSLEDWLNVLDEAAAYGANWLVITIHTSFSQFPDIWEIARWAQETHDMQVGLHTDEETFTEEDIATIKTLNPEKTRLFVRRDIMPGLKHLEAEGIRLAPADPQPYGHKPECRGPANMIFVDSRGVLYTCGLVEGNDAFRLGTIHEGTFHKILHDPSLPHTVPEKIHRISKGCDGCPSLIANFIALEPENRA